MTVCECQPLPKAGIKPTALPFKVPLHFYHRLNNQVYPPPILKHSVYRQQLQRVTLSPLKLVEQPRTQTASFNVVYEKFNPKQKQV